LAIGLDAVVFDIRYSPQSRNPAWSGRQMARRMGNRYRHIREFGNAYYHEGGDILIVNYNAGLIEVLRSNRPVILVCVCRDPSICHRTYIGRMLIEDGFTVEELTPTRVREVLKCSIAQLPLLSGLEWQ
jgi:hypothetical protein